MTNIYPFSLSLLSPFLYYNYCSLPVWPSYFRLLLVYWGLAPTILGSFADFGFGGSVAVEEFSRKFFVHTFKAELSVHFRFDFSVDCSGIETDTYSLNLLACLLARLSTQALQTFSMRSLRRALITAVWGVIAMPVQRFRAHPGHVPLMLC
jgi:hypothetical protein